MAESPPEVAEVGTLPISHPQPVAKARVAFREAPVVWQEQEPSQHVYTGRQQSRAAQHSGRCGTGSTDVLRPLGDSAEPRARRPRSTKKQDRGFVSSFPVAERKIPVYDARADPYCSRLAFAAATPEEVAALPTKASHKISSCAAAHVQMAQAHAQDAALRHKKETYYRRSMAAARAKATREAMYLDAWQMTPGGFHPAGFGLRPSLPPSNPAPSQGPRRRGARGGDLSDAERRALMGQVALVPHDSHPQASLSPSAHAPSAPVQRPSVVQRPSTRQTPVSRQVVALAKSNLPMAVARHVTPELLATHAIPHSVVRSRSASHASLHAAAAAPVASAADAYKRSEHFAHGPFVGRVVYLLELRLSHWASGSDVADGGVLDTLIGSPPRESAREEREAAHSLQPRPSSASSLHLTGASSSSPPAKRTAWAERPATAEHAAAGHAVGMGHAGPRSLPTPTVVDLIRAEMQRVEDRDQAVAMADANIESIRSGLEVEEEGGSSADPPRHGGRKASVALPQDWGGFSQIRESHLHRLLDMLSAAPNLEPPAPPAEAPAAGSPVSLASPASPASPSASAGDGVVPGGERPLVGRGGRRAGPAEGVYDTLAERQLAAFACVAEQEVNAAEAVAAWRPAEARRVAQTEACVALEAAFRAAQMAKAAEGEALSSAQAEATRAVESLSSMAAALAAALEGRVKRLWAGCELSEAGLDEVLAQLGKAGQDGEEEALQGANTAAVLSALEAFQSSPEGSSPAGSSTTAGRAAASGPGAASGDGGYLIISGRVVGARCAQLTGLLLTLRRHAERLVAVHRAVVQREDIYRHLRTACNRLAPMHAATSMPRSRLDAVPTGASVPPSQSMIASVEAEVISTVALLRQATVRVVEAVHAWRGGLTTPAPFLWPTGGASGAAGSDGAPGRRATTSNYLQLVLSDTDDLGSMSMRMASLLREAPSRLDRKRLWRAKQTIDLEAFTMRRFHTHTSHDHPTDAPLRPGLRWSPVKESELRQVTGEGPNPSTWTGLFEPAAADDATLLQALEKLRAARTDGLPTEYAVV